MISHKYRKLFDVHRPTAVFLSQFESSPISLFLLFLASSSQSSFFVLHVFVSSTLVPLFDSYCLKFVGFLGFLSFSRSSLQSPPFLSFTPLIYFISFAFSSSSAPQMISPSPLFFRHLKQFSHQQLRVLCCITPQTLYSLHKFILALVNILKTSNNAKTLQNTNEFWRKWVKRNCYLVCCACVVYVQRIRHVRELTANNIFRKYALAVFFIPSPHYLAHVNISARNFIDYSECFRRRQCNFH